MFEERKKEIVNLVKNISRSVHLKKREFKWKKRFSNTKASWFRLTDLILGRKCTILSMTIYSFTVPAQSSQQTSPFGNAKPINVSAPSKQAQHFLKDTKTIWRWSLYQPSCNFYSALTQRCYATDVGHRNLQLACSPGIHTEALSLFAFGFRAS